MMCKNKPLGLAQLSLRRCAEDCHREQPFVSQRDEALNCEISPNFIVTFVLPYTHINLLISTR